MWNRALGWRRIELKVYTTTRSIRVLEVRTVRAHAHFISICNNNLLLIHSKILSARRAGSLDFLPKSSIVAYPTDRPIQGPGRWRLRIDIDILRQPLWDGSCSSNRATDQSRS